MKFSSATIAYFTGMTAALAIPAPVKRGSISVTPHDDYSSSVGVLGCKINVNRVAYWPGSISCDNLCVKVSANGRSVNLLRIDSSGGAYDISYDAWNYLDTGKPATEDPVSGGGVSATYEEVGMDQCADLLNDNGKLPLSAANSMGFWAGCPAGSWVRQNSALYNIANPTCTVGVDELCTLNLAVSNQASCPSGLGTNSKLTSDPVYNIEYPSGKKVIAS